MPDSFSSTAVKAGAAEFGDRDLCFEVISYAHATPPISFKGVIVARVILYCILGCIVLEKIF